ncbi:SGNH/GDSL hydrolase family protein [Candidatus Bacteroides intestinigallinarum]|uniref:SGNH/GDSL hydrolase family protein n=1 Tax=Candidatus Bacteroides intestinigallinarum TaxID=2838470 RepID=UPI0021664A05|nr:SGNH/GDSL hydrolase family protein [Candidatus Bacteroides intestinigallinarum]MCS3200919.1 SGNH/GDSL hydrolase family protein [Candidatus Bacteroides intestinigallinarum]
MKKFFVLIAAVCMTYTTAFAQTVKPFKEGERAVFLGNSITDGGHYHSYIWLYYMTRFPDMPIRVFNGGIGGDTAYDMNKRLDGDIFAMKPSVLMVTFGMNDSGYFEYNGDNPKEFGEQKYQESIKNYQQMEKRFKDLADTRIVMVGTSPYDETVQLKENVPFKTKNETIKRIVEYQKESAAKNNWEFTDLNAPMVALNQQNQQKDPAFTLCGSDRIHPDNDGHMVMAYLFLKAQGFVGKEVADMEINANKKQAVKAENCTISNIKKNGKDLSFDYLAEALPYPLDTIARGWGQRKGQAEALKVIPFMDEMNREVLKVTGLKGDYKLLIDEEEIGTWSGDDLAKGINLAAESKTPQYQQALTVMHLNEYRWEIEKTFREYAWCQFGFFQQQGLLFANDRKAIEVMDENVDKNIWLKGRRDMYSKMMLDPVREAREQEMDVLINKIYEVNKPVVRKILLRKI